MPINQFAGDVVGAANANGIEPAALLAVVDVESSGEPFESDGVTPRFLFERHIFYRELKTRAAGKLDAAVAQGLAHPEWRRDTQYKDQGNSAARLALLERVRAVDVECGNRSCSWGLGQTMGFLAEELGFANASAMLDAMKAGGVTAQIAMMVKEIKRKNILDSLNRHDWDRFALRYNGPRYKENQYDTKLANAYSRWVGHVPEPPPPPPPSVALAEGARGEPVTKLQTALQERHFSVGAIDGIYGPVTREAVRAFQRANGLADSGTADEATLRALGLLEPGVVQPPRPGLDLHAVLKLLLEGILKQPAATPAAAGAPAGALDVFQRLLAVVGKLAGAALPAPAAVPEQAAAPLLSPIDKMLGGETLAGKKTALSVVAYVVLAILQAAGVIGAATPTGQILTVLITAFGALGGLSKVDRVIQALGAIASAKRGQAAPPPGG